MIFWSCAIYSILFACVSLGTKAHCQLEEQRLINEETDPSDSHDTSSEDEELQDEYDSEGHTEKGIEKDSAAGQSSQQVEEEQDSIGHQKKTKRKRKLLKGKVIKLFAYAVYNLVHMHAVQVEKESLASNCNCMYVLYLYNLVIVGQLIKQNKRKINP